MAFEKPGHLLKIKFQKLYANSIIKWRNRCNVLFLLLISLIVFSNADGRNEIKNKMSLPIPNSAISLSISTTSVSSNFSNGNGVFMNGSITISATGGTAPYSFVLVGLYSNNNGYFTLIPAGTYQVQVTDANGQIADTTAVVANVYPIPSVSFSNVIVPSSCNSADGSFSLTGSGGTPPYTYSIDGGVTFSSTNTFANLTKGVYLCLLKDANGLLASVETARGIFPNSIFFNCNCCPLNTDASGYGVSSCTDNRGYLAVTWEGGVPPIQYSIDGINYFPALPEGGYIFDNLGSGLYKAYAKDTTGFISVTTTDITRYFLHCWSSK